MIISHRLKFAFFRVPKCGSTTSEFMLRLSDAFDGDDVMTQCFGGFKMQNVPAALRDRIVRRRTRIAGGNLRMLEQANIQPVELPLSGVVTGINVAHITPAEAIGQGMITIEQLREYKCYAFLREPLDRYVSAFIFGGGPLAVPEIMLKSVLKPEFNLGLVEREQWKWFFVDDEQVVEPLDFSNYAAELKRIIVEIGGFPFTHIPRINPASGRMNDVSNDEYYDEEGRALITAKFTRDIAMWNKHRDIWDA